MKKGIFCVLVCMLMILSTIIPISATVSEKKSQYLTTGNFLYVGGSGPNNYTKIQNAIDDASNGDTVFVFDDSSPYYENIVINTSISLLGEDKNTTIIDGMENAENQVDVIIIYADGVTVQGFTIRNSYYPDINKLYDFYCGIELWSDENTIQDNIIVDNYYGIVIGSFGSNRFTKKYAENNIIEKNSITQNEYGICLLMGYKNVISNNYLSLNNWSMWILFRGDNTLIEFNTISLNNHGIELNGVKNITITHNTIVQNEGFGISIEYSKRITVLENNIYENREDASFIIISIHFIGEWMLNEFNGNYWGSTQQKPVLIPGIMYFVVLTGFVLRIQDFLNQNTTLFGIPLIKIDQHPAQEPYDISGM
jgi:parallel beta-helix repeat protein